MTDATAPLELVKIRKEFGGVVAISEFSLTLNGGEVWLCRRQRRRQVHLIKIVSGIHQPTSGEVRLGGRRVHLSDPSAARRLGVEVVHQDLAIAEHQPVYMNMFLGRELVTRRLRRLTRTNVRRPRP